MNYEFIFEEKEAFLFVLERIKVSVERIKDNTSNGYDKRKRRTERK